MNKIIIFGIALLLILLVEGCTIPKGQTEEPLQVNSTSIPKPIATSTDMVLTNQNYHPILSHWEMVGTPEIKDKNYSLVIHGYQLSGDNLTFIYSLSGTTTSELVKNEGLQLVDNQDRNIALREILPIANLKDLEIGAMIFEPRPLGATELHLQVQDRKDAKNNLDVLVSRLQGPGNQLEDRQGSIYFDGLEAALNRGNYKIKFKGKTSSMTISTPKNPDDLNGATPTPVVETPIDQSQGDTVLETFDVSIDDLNNNSTYDIVIQTFYNGKAIGKIKDKIINPIPVTQIPIVVTTAPYP